MAASPSKPAEIRFPCISHLLLYKTTNITPCCCHITPFCCHITPFFWYITENLLYVAEKTRYSMTQEQVKQLYSTRKWHPKSYRAWYIATKTAISIYHIYSKIALPKNRSEGYIAPVYSMVYSNFFAIYRAT